MSKKLRRASIFGCEWGATLRAVCCCYRDIPELHLFNSKLDKIAAFTRTGAKQGQEAACLREAVFVFRGRLELETSFRLVLFLHLPATRSEGNDTKQVVLRLVIHASVCLQGATSRTMSIEHGRHVRLPHYGVGELRKPPAC